MTFKSTSIEVKSPGQLAVTGELTIHGVSKTVTFEVEGPTTAIGWKVQSKDFGLGWNAALETGGVLVGEDVAITLDVEFVKA